MSKVKCPKCGTERPYQEGNQKVNCKNCGAQIKICAKNVVPESTKRVPKVPIKVPPKKNNLLDYKVLLRACNNYLKGYNTAYTNAKNKGLTPEFSQVIEHYEEVLAERKKLLKFKARDENDL